MILKRRRRPGYTLLEIMLAVGIGLLLVAALYVALDLQMRYMATGRDAVTETQMSRGLLQKVGNDIRNSMGLLSTSTSWREAIPPPQDSTTQQQPPTGMGTTGQTTPTEETSPFGTSQYCDLRSFGTETTLTLYVAALPRYAGSQSDTPLGLSDVRRITYAVEAGKGLVRQEVRNPDTLGDVTSAEPAIVLAPEVMDLRFRYYDLETGAWTTTWDGSVNGPPSAVEITMTLQAFNINNEPIPGRPPITHRMVIAIPTGAPLPDPSLAQGGTQ